MSLDFSEVDRVTKEFIDESNKRIADRIMGVAVANDVDRTVTFVTSDGVHFTEISTWSEPPIIQDGHFSGKNRPQTRNDLIERLMKYEWGAQLDILAYMRKFDTWDALYADLDQRAAESATEVRNVTPEKQKQVRENNG